MSNSKQRWSHDQLYTKPVEDLDASESAFVEHEAKQQAAELVRRWTSKGPLYLFTLGTIIQQVGKDGYEKQQRRSMMSGDND